LHNEPQDCVLLATNIHGSSHWQQIMILSNYIDLLFSLLNYCLR
jgi:hypothetical protein